MNIYQIGYWVNLAQLKFKGMIGEGETEWVASHPLKNVVCASVLP